MAEEEKTTAAAPKAADESRPPRKQVGCLQFLLGGLVLLLLAIGCWAWWLHGARKEFLAHAERLIHEVEDERPAVADSENSLPLYLQAFKMLRSQEECGMSTDDRVKLDWMRVSDVDAKLLAKYLQDNEPAIQLMRSAQARPACARQLTLRGANGLVEALIPDHIFGFTGASRILAVTAVVRAREGRIQEAGELLAINLRLARDVRRVGGAHSVHYQHGMEERAGRAIEATLKECGPDAALVERLLAALTEHEQERRSLKAAFNEQRALELRFVYVPLVSGEMSADEGLEPLGLRGGLKCAFWQKSGCVIRDARYFDETMLRIIATSEMPCPEANIEARRLQQELDRSPGWWALASAMHFNSTFTVSLIPREARARTWLHMARLALGCRLHKLQSGSYPEKLSDLSARFPERFKELPADPFTGKEMLYRRTEKGCLVWSVGEDRKDDGGDAKKDIVFELTR